MQASNLFNYFSVCLNHLSVPFSRIFYDAVLVFEIGIYQSKTIVITAGPLKIICQSPVKISFHGNSFLYRPFQLIKIPVEKINPLQIMHLSVKENPVLIRKTIFCDI